MSLKFARTFEYNFIFRGSNSTSVFINNRKSSTRRLYLQCFTFTNRRIYEIKDENVGYKKVYAISPKKLSVIVDSFDELFYNRVYFRQFTDKTIFNGGKFKAFVRFIYSSIRSS